ncbi:MAG: AAA family ATPase [Chloroflexi bacterium]|nr:AAA family ATPase [Chloroflexota bacterium]
MLYSLMTELWQHRSQANPLVIVCDDLHWADPASVALLEHLFALTENSPILFLCATRPERESPVWELRRHAADIYTHRTILIELKPLSASDSSILVDTLLDISDLPAEIRTRILLKADGNPFYVEEVVRTLIETGSVLHDAGGLHWQMTNNNGTIDIPDNLLALLTARMDRLDEESRRVLQLAALIGRSFYYRVLERVAVFLEDNDSGFRLVSSLNQLQQMNMIRETAKIPELEYMFHHPLTQEAAYNTILLKRRRAYHRAVADAIVGLYGDRLEEFAPVLGYHFEGAGDAAQAISYYTHAGDTAMRLFAKVEAIEHYSNALTLVASHPQTDTDQLAHLYLRYGRALELNGQFADALANYQEMETLAGENRDQHLRLDSWVAQMIILSTPTDQTDEVLAKQFGSRALPLAQQLGDRKAEARIYWATMNMHRFNNADEAIEIGEKGLLLARELGDSELLAYTLNDIGYSYRSTGRLQHTIEALSEAIELWRGLNNLPMLSDSLTTLAHQHIFQAEFERAFELCNEAYTVSEAINNRWGMSYSRYLVGDIHWRQGHISTAIATMEQAIADGDSRWRSSRFRRGAHQCES